VIVVDASAAIAALLNNGPARAALASESVHVPHIIDPEIANGLRGLVASGKIRAKSGAVSLTTWQRLGVARYPIVGILDRVWSLRHNLSAYDASYVALAEALQCSLVTADGRLARASGVRCPITTVPR